MIEYSLFEKMVGEHFVRDEALVGKLNSFLYEYNIPINELSNISYQLLVWELDSIELPGCRSMDGG